MQNAGDRGDTAGSSGKVGGSSGAPSYWSGAEGQAVIQAQDQAILQQFAPYGLESLSQISPELVSDWAQIQYAKTGGVAGFLDKAIPVATIAGLTAGIGGVAAAAIAPEIAAASAAAGASASAAATIGTIGGGVAAGAVGSSLGGALTGTLSGENVGIGALTGGLGAAVAPAVNSIADDIGVSRGAAGAVVGAGIGATKGEITGQGAASGAITGGITGAATGSGSSPLIAGLAGTGVASLLGGGKTSSSSASYSSPAQYGDYQSVTSPGVPPVATGLTSSTNDLANGTSSSTGSALLGTDNGSSFLGNVGTGLLSTLGGQNLGQSLGTALPYAGVVAIGMEQASAGQANDAKYSQQQQALAQPAIAQSNSLLGQYNSGKLNATDQAVVDTGVAQGQTTIASANGLSAIAQTAFANYNSGNLNTGDQLKLDQDTAAAKQQVAQTLSQAGITDSTILAAQYQNIDNQAQITKQNLLNGYFNTGNQAYNSYLTATQDGQQTIQAAQQYASKSLNNYLSQSMSEAQIGIGEVNTAIQTQMTTDANYANQVSTLLGTLATAYAKQVAGQKSGSNGSNGASALEGAGASSLLNKYSGGSGNSGQSNGVNSVGASNGDITNINQTADPNLYSDINAGNAGIGAQNSIDLSNSFDESDFGDYFSTGTLG